VLAEEAGKDQPVLRSPALQYLSRRIYLEPVMSPLQTRSLVARLLTAMALACLFSVCQADARGQMMFQTSLKTYNHLKTEWPQWSKSKPGDFVVIGSPGSETSNRFEVLETGDHMMKVAYTQTISGKANRREITYLFNKDKLFQAQPGAKTPDTITVAGKEFECTRWDYMHPFKKTEFIKQVWYSDAAPFDGMVKWLQYTPGKPNSVREILSMGSGAASTPAAGDIAAAPAPVPAGTTPATDEPTTDEPTDEPTTPSPMPAGSDPGDPLAGSDPMPAKPARQPPKEDPRTAIRTWTSANGQFKIEAAMTKFIAGTVYLKRADSDTIIKVPAASLSEADQKFIRRGR